VLETRRVQAGPESFTATSTPFGSAARWDEQLSDPPRPAHIAWTALTMRLRTTCLQLYAILLRQTANPSEAGCTGRRHSHRFAPVSSITCGDRLFMSTRSFRGGAFLMSSRIRPMESPARWASLTIR